MGSNVSSLVDLVLDGTEQIAAHELAFDHTLIAGAAQTADLGTAAYEDTTAFEVAGAVSGHELAFDHTLIATAAQVADLGTAAYEDVEAFEVAGAAASYGSSHESAYDHTLIATATQPTDNLTTLGSGAATDGQLAASDGAAGVEWINNTGGFSEAATLPTGVPYGTRCRLTTDDLCYTYIPNEGTPAWVEL